MRFFLGSILLLGGCSSPLMRCDAHLRPINAPAAKTGLAAPNFAAPNLAAPGLAAPGLAPGVAAPPATSGERL